MVRGVHGRHFQPSRFRLSRLVSLHPADANGEHGWDRKQPQEPKQGHVRGGAIRFGGQRVGTQVLWQADDHKPRGVQDADLDLGWMGSLHVAPLGLDVDQGCGAGLAGVHRWHPRVVRPIDMKTKRLVVGQRPILVQAVNHEHGDNGRPILGTGEGASQLGEPLSLCSVGGQYGLAGAGSPGVDCHTGGVRWPGPMEGQWGRQGCNWDIHCGDVLAPYRFQLDNGGGQLDPLSDIDDVRNG
mmetsp:Transcript_34174/g.61249  ORF Transcript_34174/g.61249 Transcript_34174/m.61249 type:complete len:241 (-) Transcript_34174:347-1069(-)